MDPATLISMSPSCEKYDDEEVTELLRGAYNDEIKTVMNYLTNTVVLDGVSAEEVKPSSY